MNNLLFEVPFLILVSIITIYAGFKFFVDVGELLRKAFDWLVKI